MSLSKGVYSKGDCGKLKIKYSYHARRSKKNTYHVVNKNIASSKFTDGLKTKQGMPSEASPSLDAWLSLNITLGCLGHSQAQALATPYSIVHQIFTQNLKTSQQKTHKIRQYNKANHHFRYCCELILNLYWCNIYCIPTSSWFISPDTTHRFIKISKQHIENRIYQKQNSLQLRKF